MLRYKEIGIYIIKSKHDEKVYIGKSSDIKSRMLDHLRRLKINKHCNSHLQNAYNLYGKDNFSVHVLEYCSIDTIDEREKFFIHKYDSTNSVVGYNFKHGGQGKIFTQLLKDELRISKIATCKKVFGFNELGVLVKTWISISQCAEDLKVNPCDVRRTISQVQRRCRGYILNNENKFRLRDYKINFNKNSLAKHKAGSFIEGINYINI